MKSQNRSTKILAATIALNTVILTCTAQAQTDERHPRVSINYSGIIAIAPGESANLNVTNLDRDPIIARLVFIDSAGDELKAMNVRVAGGHSAFLTLNYGELGDRTGRAAIGAVLMRPASESEKPVVSTAEVFDNNSGRTSFGLLLPAVLTAHNFFALATDEVTKVDQ